MILADLLQSSSQHTATKEDNSFENKRLKGDQNLATNPTSQVKEVHQRFKRQDTLPNNTRGIKGEKGCKGEAGNPGFPGTQGEIGDFGPRGDPGISGPPGQTGLPGIKGSKGDRGMIGPRGNPGLPGQAPQASPAINNEKNYPSPGSLY